jgi:hypothetical protein
MSGPRSAAELEAIAARIRTTAADAHRALYPGRLGEPPADIGVEIATIPAGPGRELRLRFIVDDRGRPSISIRIWESDPGNVFWPLRGLGLVVRDHELVPFGHAVAKGLSMVANQVTAARNTNERNSR